MKSILNAKRVIIFGGIIVGIIIISIIILSIFHETSESGTCIPTSPGSLFYLENEDVNQSHVVKVIIATSNNQTLAEELYVMKPAASVYSQFRSTIKPEETFFVTFIVDDSITSHAIIVSTTTCCTSFTINSSHRVFSSQDILCRDVPCYYKS